MGARAGWPKAHIEKWTAQEHIVHLDKSTPAHKATERQSNRASSMRNRKT